MGLVTVISALEADILFLGVVFVVVMTGIVDLYNRFSSACPSVWMLFLILIIWEGAVDKTLPNKVLHQERLSLRALQANFNH